MASSGKRLQTGMVVRDREGVELGTVGEVWTDAGVAESWGATGAIPIEGTSAADPREYAFSEAMPGEGESYFRLRCPDGRALYVPLSYVQAVRDDATVLSVAADEIPALQWDVRPDWLNNHQVPDSGAPSSQA
ncbi:MAG: hypothetical protein IRZ14_11985 [Chloroflexi bacterium]|nr:hypothetical protein [Chloroflexota bacterium]